MRRILSIDGGGLKGAIPAGFLATIQGQLADPIVQHFDLVAGTSTGAIIALGLGLGLSADEIVTFYEKRGPRIFQQELGTRNVVGRVKARAEALVRGFRRLTNAKYDSKTLAEALREAFGEKRLGDSSTRLLIPAFDSVRRDIHVFKTAHHTRFRTDYKASAVDVALSSAAAPTYLPAHVLETGITLLDGGIWANNPTLLAVVEAIGVLCWPREDIYVLSLGCGETVSSIPTAGGLLTWAARFTEVASIGQSRSAIGGARLLTGERQIGERIVRIDHSVPVGRYNLDSASLLNELRGIGAASARHELPRLRETFFAAPAERFVPVVS